MLRYQLPIKSYIYMYIYVVFIYHIIHHIYYHIIGYSALFCCAACAIILFSVHSLRSLVIQKKALAPVESATVAYLVANR